MEGWGAGLLATAAALVALVVGVLALVGLQHTVRATPLARVEGGAEPIAVSDPAFPRVVGLLTGTPIEHGSDVEVLANGDETFPRLWADLRAATQAISVQLYYAKAGRVADEFAAIVAERVRAGVAVRVLFDAIGARPLLGPYCRALRAAGVEVAVFRPLRWWALHEAQRRSHVRLVVVDGRVAHTGCFGLADQWLGGGRHAGEWRDTNVRCVGALAARFQAAFAAAWTEATGALLLDEALYSGASAAAGGAVAGGEGGLAGLLVATPSLGSTAAERFLAASIAGARRRLWLTNSYVAPDDAFVALLTDVARRRVDVRLLTAGGRSDVPAMYYAARARYEALLAGGVRIWEYQPSMLHAKTLVADGRWCSVGTMSFDNRALALNDESTLLVSDCGVGARLEALFDADLAHAREVRLGEFRRRPWTGRVAEWGATAVSRVL